MEFERLYYENDESLNEMSGSKISRYFKDCVISLDLSKALSLAVN